MREEEAVWPSTDLAASGEARWEGTQHLSAGPVLGLPSPLTVQGLCTSLLALSGRDPLSRPGMLILQGSSWLIPQFFLHRSSQRAPPAPRLRITGFASRSVLCIYHCSTRRAFHRFPRLLPPSLVRRQAPGWWQCLSLACGKCPESMYYLQFLVELFSCCSSCWSIGCARMLCRFSRVWLSATPWTVARQPPLPMGFSRQEYGSGLPCPPPGDLPHPGIKPLAPVLQEDFCHWATRERP